MAFKITFIEKVGALINALNSNAQPTEATFSFQPNSKFSDIKTYVEGLKISKSMTGKVSKQTDSGFLYVFEYIFDGKSMYSKFGGYRVNISHVGEKVNSLELYLRQPSAAANCKFMLNKLEEKVPQIPAGEVVSTEVPPKEDYSTKTLAELVNVFDKKLKEFKKDSTMTNLNVLAEIRDAMSGIVDEKPLAERAPFEEPLSKRTTYIDALKMQMSSPLANTTQFVSMYTPQMATSLSELAKLV